MADTIFGFAAAFFIARNPCGFFNKSAQVLGFRFDKARNGALLNNGVTARTKACAHKQVGNVFTATLLAIEKIPRLTVSAHLTLNGDFFVTGILTREATLFVFKNKFNTCHRHRFSGA